MLHDLEAVCTHKLARRPDAFVYRLLHGVGNIHAKPVACRRIPQPVYQRLFCAVAVYAGNQVLALAHPDELYKFIFKRLWVKG